MDNPTAEALTEIQDTAEDSMVMVTQVTSIRDLHAIHPMAIPEEILTQEPAAAIHAHVMKITTEQEASMVLLPVVTLAMEMNTEAEIIIPAVTVLIAATTTDNQ